MRQLSAHNCPVRHVGVQARRRRESHYPPEVVVVRIVGGIRPPVRAEAESVRRRHVRMRPRIAGRIALRDLRLEGSRRARLAGQGEDKPQQHGGNGRWDELVWPHDRMPPSPSRLVSRLPLGPHVNRLPRGLSLPASLSARTTKQSPGIPRTTCAKPPLTVC